ncbi:MAG: methionyl-tRNA formyltransferase [Salibacteraceae bacterium]
MRIVFLGTPDFAVGILEALIDANKNIVGVVTAPDKPAGRGKKLQQSAVKQCAIKHSLQVLQPTNLKDEDFLEELKNLKADIQIVVAFRMLPEVVWNMPELGTFNLHASLLPQYRGAAPINWAIINGETKTGVTTFFLKHEIDTGDVLDQTKVEIGKNENVGSLYYRLMDIGAKKVVETLTRIEAGDLSTTPQSELAKGKLKEAHKIFKPFCKIDWNETANNIHNKIRGLSPYPCAFTRVVTNSKELGLKLYESSIEHKPNTTPNQVVQEKNKLGIEVSDGVIWLHEIQLEGKKRMKTEDFLRGFSDQILIA